MASWSLRDLIRLQEDRRKDRRQSRTVRIRTIDGPMKPFGEILGGLFKDNPETQRKIQIGELMSTWPELVGAAAAGVSQPIKIRDTTLIVKVQDTLWMNQLSLIKSDLLRQLRQRFPAIQLTQIFFVT